MDRSDWWEAGGWVVVVVVVCVCVCWGGGKINNEKLITRWIKARCHLGPNAGIILPSASKEEGGWIGSY